MATIVWCDHIRHIVEEPRSVVQQVIEDAQRNLAAPYLPDDSRESWDICPRGFVFLTPEGGNPHSTPQRALNVALISSFEALPGDPA